MKKNYIEPTSKCIELEAEELLNSLSIVDGETCGYALEEEGMNSKSRSNYAHEDLGWDY